MNDSIQHMTMVGAQHTVDSLACLSLTAVHSPSTAHTTN
jgi:hypothetical protein